LAVSFCHHVGQRRLPQFALGWHDPLQSDDGR
jgi:hypothetical protein